MMLWVQFADAASLACGCVHTVWTQGTCAAVQPAPECVMVILLHLWSVLDAPCSLLLQYAAKRMLPQVCVQLADACSACSPTNACCGCSCVMRSTSLLAACIAE